MNTDTPREQAELQRSEAQRGTFREVSENLEAKLFFPIPVLDHGFVRVVDYMGNDSSVVQAARVSYGRGTKQVSEDRGLINYLMRHKHSTPFEMADIKLHVKLPIFVARQWIRHRTASVNEYSARYSVLDKEFYVPAAEHLSAQSTTNKQGRGTVLEALEASRALKILKEGSLRAYDDYLTLLNVGEDGTDLENEFQGLARELARANLTLAYYTQWYWKTNLHNLLGFLQLRADVHAQYEIRAYANVILDIVKAWVPLTYEAFVEHRLGAISLSASAARYVNRRLQGEPVDENELSPRELRELREHFPSL